MKISIGDRILFEGDSVTDCGRNRGDLHSLAGYSAVADGYLKLFFPELKTEVYNRGVSGDTSKMLLDRFEKSLEEVKPTVISILIGINDVWRRYDSGKVTSVAEYIQNYTQILALAQKYTSRIVVLEPFVIPSDKNKAKFCEDLDPKLNALRELVRAKNVEYIPLDGIFAGLTSKNSPELYSADGIHPIAKGHSVIAAEWLKNAGLTL